MAKFSIDAPELLTPLGDFQPENLSFEATLNAHGLYTTEEFVLRLSPRVHELVDAITRGETDGYDRADLVRAYSTYIHETIHWWQHVGSTSGLILSLALPTQCLSSMGALKTTLERSGARKPLKHWAVRVESGIEKGDVIALGAANEAINNMVDLDFYKRFQFNPLKVQSLYQSPYFESVGHIYHIAYITVLEAIKDSCGLASNALADLSKWNDRYEALRDARHEGFHPESPIRRARVGLRDIFEGQARLTQVQFLAASGGPSEWESYEKEGFFAGPYITAFDEFARLTGVSRPSKVNDSVVALFLLICDMAINPYGGLPFDIDYHENLIRDLDPGARFTYLTEAAAAEPELFVAIKSFSADEYWDVSGRLATSCGYITPLAGLKAIRDLAENDPGARLLLEERSTFEFSQQNIPVRVMMAGFLAFSEDKLSTPEFACWPGVYAAGGDIAPQHQRFFTNHLSLFSDRGDTEQVFPRNFPGKSPAAIKATLDGFFGSLMLYDLAHQWALRDGTFQFEYSWLTGRSSHDELTDWVKRTFKAQFGVGIDDFELCKSP